MYKLLLFCICVFGNSPTSST